MLRDVIEVSKLQSAIVGVLAGFALTIVALLVERLSSRPSSDRYDAAMAKAAISVFVGTVFTSMLASFLYSVNGGEPTLSARSFVLFLLPSFIFALSSILLALGLVFVLGSYRLSHAVGIVQLVLFGTIFVSVSNYISGTVEAIAIMADATSPQVFTVFPIKFSSFIIPTFSLLVGLAFREYRHRRKGSELDLRLLNWFVYACVAGSALVGGLAPFVHNMSFDVSIPFWITFIPATVLSVLAAWSTIFTPRSI